MTKKDYELIARTIKRHCDERPGIDRAELAVAFGLLLEGTDERFNLTQFIIACGA